MKLRTMIITTIVMMVLFAIMSYAFSHKQIISLQKKIDSNWTQLEQQLQHRSDIIMKLITLITTDRPDVQIPASLKSEQPSETLSQPKDIRQSFQQQSLEINEFLTLVKNRPDIIPAEQFNSLQNELLTNKQQIDAAHIRYNHSVEQYNATIVRFPGSLIAEQNGLKPEFILPQ